MRRWIIHPVQVTGTFDDISDDIHYTGLWSHGLFAEAAGGTVSFSNDPGAVARLSFEGSEITWVYTKAFNRGIAEVKLDGIARGEIDLYSPKIVWQARKTFDRSDAGKAHVRSDRRRTKGRRPPRIDMWMWTL